MHVTLLWSFWQGLLAPFKPAFTAGGFRRFVVWITGLALNVEEHTITQSLIALGLHDRWKELENFAEIGHWDQPVVEESLAELLEETPGRFWYGYRVHACDDSKTHRSSKKVWGHLYLPRVHGSLSQPRPNRARP